MPLVSVIIPNYNHSSYLKERIDSVLNQTFQDFEILILDDCSSDNSKDVIEKYRLHPKVAGIYFNEQNSGSTFRQWNKGVALAKGELIWIAESDDNSDPAFLEELVNTLNANYNVGIAFANSYIINEDGQKLTTFSKEFLTWSDRWQDNYINNGAEECIKYLRNSPVILNVSSCVFRKEVFVKAGGSDESFRLAGDWMTYIKMLRICDIAYNAKPLNLFRKHQNTVRSLSSEFTLFFETIKVVCSIYEYFKIPKKAGISHIYSLLGQLAKLSPEISLSQKKEVLGYMRKHLDYNVYYMWIKLRFSLYFKKNNT